MAGNTNYYTKSKREKINTVAPFSDRNKEDPLKVQAAKFFIHIILTVIFYGIVIVAVCRLGTMAYNFTYPIFGDATVTTTSGKDVTITITKNESLSSIIEDLEKKHVIDNGASFYIRCKLSLTKYKTIIPGTYTLNTSQNYGEILDILTATDEENTEE